MDAELVRTLHFVLDLLRDYGLNEFYLELSTKPPGKAVGSDEEWDVATEALRRTALEMGLDLVMDEGGGAFYGPKISVQARDAIGRTWQMSTVQLDFQLPQRFGLEYVGADNARHRPIMIHRALFGSVERFMAVLIEHYAGALPTWLSPEQVRVVPVTDAHARLRAVGGRRLRGGRAAGDGRRQRREARRPDPPGQAGQDPLRARRGRRGRGRRDGRGEPARLGGQARAGRARRRPGGRGHRRGRTQGAPRGQGARAGARMSEGRRP